MGPTFVFNIVTVLQERRSFYVLPKTLSEEDDTFGVHQRAVNNLTVGQADFKVDTGLVL